jgi:hypothetical protein
MVTLATATKRENDTGNDFVDSNNGAISGTVKDYDGQALKNVVIQLKDSTGAIIKTATTLSNLHITTILDAGSNVVATTLPDSNGKYLCAKVPPGDYLVIKTTAGTSRAM